MVVMGFGCVVGGRTDSPTELTTQLVLPENLEIRQVLMGTQSTDTTSAIQHVPVPLSSK